LLLAPTISGLRALLRTCENYLNDVDNLTYALRQTNHCAFGLDVDIIHTALHLPHASGGAINWVDCCRYLGVFFNSGCTFKRKFENTKSCFFRAFNAFYSKVGRLASEEVVLSLIRAKCLPINTDICD